MNLSSRFRPGVWGRILSQRHRGGVSHGVVSPAPANPRLQLRAQSSQSSYPKGTSVVPKPEIPRKAISRVCRLPPGGGALGGYPDEHYLLTLLSISAPTSRDAQTRDLKVSEKFQNREKPLVYFPTWLRWCARLQESLVLI